MLYQTQPTDDSCLATCMASIMRIDIRTISIPLLSSNEPAVWLPELYNWARSELLTSFTYYEFLDLFKVWAPSGTECVIAGPTESGVRHACVGIFNDVDGQLALEVLMNPSNIELLSIDTVFILHPSAL